jgi:hypothetical protein
MAVKKVAPVKKVKAADEDYSKLDEYTIGLNEYFKSLRKAGFTKDDALWILTAKGIHPEWLEGPPSLDAIKKHLEDEDD